MAGLLTHTPATFRLIGQVNVSYYEGFQVVTDPLTGRSRNVSQLRSEGPVVDRITGFSINPKLGSQRGRNLHSRKPARIRR
ncbi:MAG: hypothetical protein ACLP8S_05560 [Solirubrobacteraceae bacterium]